MCSSDLLGLTKKFEDGILYFVNDLKKNIEEGDKNYLSILDRADEYIKKNNLEFPEEPEARIIESDPECITNPILKLDLEKYNIKSIIWATGYTQVDRKSTRLNSSHKPISYAVFCLKKKNKPIYIL